MTRQRVELDGRTYEVVFRDNGRVSVSQLTKRGPRTLLGYGRQYRPKLADQVIAEAKAAQLVEDAAIGE